MCKVKNGKTETISELYAVYADGTATFHDIVESSKGFSEIKPLLRKMENAESYFLQLYVKGNNIMIPESTNNYCKDVFNGFNILTKHHFDVFDLIFQGLAEEI